MENGKADKQLFFKTVRGAAQRKAFTELKAEEAYSIDENDLQARDNEKWLRELETSLSGEVDLKHRIVYDGHDICYLSKQGRLKTKFKIERLKEIYEAYGAAIR